MTSGSSSLGTSPRRWQASAAGQRLESLSLPRNALSGPLLPELMTALPVGEWMGTCATRQQHALLHEGGHMTQHNAGGHWTAMPPELGSGSLLDSSTVPALYTLFDLQPCLHLSAVLSMQLLSIISIHLLSLLPAAGAGGPHLQLPDGDAAG
jgi:hypothetical protein